MWFDYPSNSDASLPSQSGASTENVFSNALATSFENHDVGAFPTRKSVLNTPGFIFTREEDSLGAFSSLFETDSATLDPLDM